MAQNFQPAALYMVHQKERDAAIALHIALADLLHFASKVGIADGACIQHPQKASPAVPELHIRPVSLAVAL